MKHWQDITGEDGVNYTAITYKNHLTLLSFESEDGTQFMVVEHLTEGENGLYTWGHALYFDEDIVQAFYQIECQNKKNEG